MQCASIQPLSKRFLSNSKTQTPQKDSIFLFSHGFVAKKRCRILMEEFWSGLQVSVWISLIFIYIHTLQIRHRQFVCLMMAFRGQPITGVLEVSVMILTNQSPELRLRSSHDSELYCDFHQKVLLSCKHLDKTVRQWFTEEFPECVRWCGFTGVAVLCVTQ